MTQTDRKALFYSAVIALGGFIFGFDAAVISGVEPFIKPEFGLDDLQRAQAFAAGVECPIDSDGERWTEWTPFSYPFNLTRQPAASVPCGFTSDGLPAGLQIVGPLFQDALVLRAARAYEQVQPFEMPNL